MKKILIYLVLSISFLTYTQIQTTYAEGGIKVTVTEQVPGASCGKEVTDNGDGTFTYEVGKGFSSIVCVMGGIIKYFTYLVGLAGVLYIIINGIMYSMGGMDPGMKDEAKKRIIATIVGLILLFMSGVILNIIAPWIYK